MLSAALKQLATGLSTAKSSSARDYNVPDLNLKVFLKGLAISSATILITGLLCYDSFIAAAALIPYIPYYFHRLKAKMTDEQKWKLNLEFRDLINCMSSALESGYSVENAVKESYRDMLLSYGEDEPIMAETRIISNKLSNGISVEEAFTDLGDRSGLEDISGFADLFAISKRTGGNIIGIIRSTASVIHTRVELKKELRTVIASKKLESDIMKVIPFGILAYLRVFSPDMIAPLYSGVFGRVFMTVFLLLYVGLSALADRIVKIEM